VGFVDSCGFANDRFNYTTLTSLWKFSFGKCMERFIRVAEAISDGKLYGIKTCKVFGEVV
jgi:hypothetical protein